MDEKFPLSVEKAYQPRHMSPEQLVEITNLYHLGKCALSGKDNSKYNRMIWASSAFNKLHPEISKTAAYKDLSNSLEGW
jgi:hypothetical protein